MPRVRYTTPVNVGDKWGAFTVLELHDNAVVCECPYGHVQRVRRQGRYITAASRWFQCEACVAPLPTRPSRPKVDRMASYYIRKTQVYRDGVAAQQGYCALCSKAAAVLRIDHCHATGRFRGLLCCECNRMLGFGYDTPTTFYGAAWYLSRPPLPWTYNDLLGELGYRWYVSACGCCEICGYPNLQRRQLVIDHSHHTGFVRGLLCDSCNSLIGLAHDDANLCAIAAAYLEAPCESFAFHTSEEEGVMRCLSGAWRTGTT